MANTKPGAIAPKPTPAPAPETTKIQDALNSGAEIPKDETPPPAPETPAPVVVKEPTSEKLTELKAKLSAAKITAATAVSDSKEQDAAFDEVYKVKEEIKVELANIRKTEAEAEQKEREAKIVALFDNAIALYDNHNTVKNSDADNDTKNIAYHAYQSAREVVVNKLLGQAPKPEKSAGATGTGVKGETSTKILELIKANRAAGLNDTDNKAAVVKAGYAVGTIWGILDKFKKENGAVA